MAELSKIYRFVNNTSIDVLAGALAGACFFFSVMNVPIQWNVLASLGITVWIIYTADHLLDARKIGRIASTPRHRFHQKSAATLLRLLLTFALLDCAFILSLPANLLYGGMILGILVALYIVINHQLRLVKEVAGAVFYTSGVVLPAVIFSGFQVSMLELLLIVHFMITAWINLLLFAMFGREDDEKDNHHSFATVVGDRAASLLLRILFLICLVFGVFYLSFSQPVGLIIMIMDVMLLVIFLGRRYFIRNERYRFAGDAVFLLPLLYLLI